MINQKYQLVSPRQFEISYADYSLNKAQVVVRPKYLSICAADQRYYTGTRGEEVMKKKLPMALIHEGVGEVVFDSTNTFKVGTPVVMVPNTPIEENEFVAENYLRSSRFRSSGYDGFMQDFIFLDADRLVQLPEEFDLEVLAFTELVTIAMHALRRFETKSINKRDTFGVWGDGNLGYITCLLLRKIYPEAKIFAFGKTDYKMSHFAFTDQTFNINEVPEGVEIDHGIECVGGRGSQSAIDQIIDLINPEGAICLLGVSEYPVEINTRMVLEKGLTLIGSSRSGAKDFQDTVNLYKKNPDLITDLSLLIGSVNEVRTINDIVSAFEADLTSSWGKTVMKWSI